MRLQTGIVALALMAGACWAQDAKEVVRKMTDHYKSLKGATVKLSLDIDMGDNPMAAMMGDLDQVNQGYAVKPNRFAFWHEGESGGGMAGMPQAAVWSDGEEIVSAIPDASLYSVTESPADFADMATDEGGMMSPNAWQMIPGADMLLQLMASNVEEKVAEMLGEAEYKGVEGEGAEKTHVFLTVDNSPQGQGMKLEIHIAAEGEPWLVAVEPQFEDANEMMAGVTAVMRLTDWKPIDTAPEAGKIEVQDDWKKVDNLLMAAMQGAGAMQDEPADVAEPEAPGKDTPAPAFSLETLKGDTFTLADHRGKVVVLDFWATWCGPCVRGLPTVSAIMNDYASKGVVFAAVNLAEEPDQVAKFMKDKGWDFTVAFDRDGDIANQFGVTGIPHSVIIDKNGVIREVHIGFDPNGVEEYKQQVTGELDALLAE